MSTSWKPADMPTLIPGLPGGGGLIEFTKRVFDAKVLRAYSEVGATSKEAPKDQFYGDRNARVVDPFGSQWSIATHVEDVSEEEMNRRMKAWEKSQA